MYSYHNLPSDTRRSINSDTANRDELAITVAPLLPNRIETSSSSAKKKKKLKKKARQQVVDIRLYGFSPFEHIHARISHHLSYLLAGGEAFFASTSFAAPTITALVESLNELLIKHGKTPIGHSDLLSVLGLLCATPGFLLFQTGNRLTNEIILQRIRYCYRLQDLLFLGITHRWFDKAYNHDSRWMNWIELIFLPIIHGLLAVSPASGLTQAAKVIDDPNYILKKFIANRSALLMVASIGTYLPILLINGTYLSKITTKRLNQLAAKLGDASQIAQKRAELLSFLAQFGQIDFNQVDKEQFLRQLTEYKGLSEKFSAEKLIKLQLYKLAQLRSELDLTFYPDTRSMKIWDVFSTIAASVLAIIAAVPTYSLSYDLVNVTWFRGLTRWAVGWKKCLLGNLIGANAMLMPIPINYVSCKELLMSFANIKQLPIFLKNCSYVEARNISFAIILSAFSGMVSFYLAYANPMQLFKDCKETSPAWLVGILHTVYNLMNQVVPYANGVNSFALAFKSLLDFLTEQNLKVEKEALRNAQYMPGLYNSKGERHYQRHLLEAAQQMFLEEIARLEDYLQRVSGKQKIAKLPARADLEDVEQQIKVLENRSGNKNQNSQNSYTMALLLKEHGTLRRRATHAIQPDNGNESQTDEELQTLIADNRASRSIQRKSYCCTIS